MSETKRPQQPPIAIVGLGALFPDSLDVARFWGHILAGSDLITDIPESHWSVSSYYDPDPSAPDKTYAHRGGFLPEVPFDSLGFGLPPNLLASTDTSQLLGLLVAQTTLDDATSGRFAEIDKSRISCILGVTSGQELFGQMSSRLRRPEWVAGMRAAGIDEETAEKAADKIGECFVPWTESSFPGLLGNVVAGRIANRLDLGGTNAVTDAACASSFAAISMGIDELVLGRADMVLSGGVDTLNDIFMYMCFSKTPALSASGRVRPFDAAADGTLLGEGLGMLALKRLDDAERDGDEIYAVIRGVGTSSDGRSKSVYAPVSEGQANALRRAYAAAGYGPETVELVEAHGTGTRAGDVAEVGGLKLAFDESGREDRQWCALGSVKSQIGHTKSAAGAAGLMKVALALHDKALPPTIGVEEPNPKAGFEQSPFYVNTRARPWIRAGGEHPRRASVSSFGFGGSNFHITVEEYAGPGHKPGRVAPRSAELFALSGDDKAAVASHARALLEALGDERRTWWTVAQSAAETFSSSAPARLALVARGREEAIRLLEAAASSLEQGEAPRGPALAWGEGALEGKVAFLYPGQGSQYVGMAGDLALGFDAARAALDRTDAVALEEGTRLSQRLFPPPAFTDEEQKAQAAALQATEWAQPALGAASLATEAVLAELGVKPDVVAGHSFGELSALRAAGCFDEESLLLLARKRGELMAAASESAGRMSAVNAAPAAIEEALGGDLGELVLANENAPDQTVIAGAADVVERASARLEEKGLKVRPLPVATAFHSPLVEAAVEPLRSFLDELPWSEPEIPVWANATASPYPASADEGRALLAEQVKRPVRFVDEIEALHDDGVRVFVEVGAGSALTGLVDRILEGREHVATATDARRSGGVRAFLLGVARLAAAGVELRPSALFAGRKAPPVRPKGKLEVPLGGSNVGKPALPEPAPVQARPPAPAPTSPPRSSPRPAPAASTSAPPPVAAMAAAPSVSSSPASVSQKMSSNRSGPPPSDRPQAPVRSRPAAPAQGAPKNGAPAGWLEVYREGQQQTAHAHEAFQQALADTHLAFLQAFEASNAQLASLLSGAEVPAGALAAPPAAAPSLPAPTPQAPAAPPPAPARAAAPTAAPAPVRGAPGNGVPANGAAAAAVRPAPAPVAQATAAPAAPAGNGVDVQALFLDVVADKTGYPKDALELTMELEADLGIDSIKRVEILSALKEKAPALPDLDAMQASQLSTLGAICDALGTTSAPSAAPASAAPTPAAPAPAGGNGVDVQALFLDVVADKTGYPKDALELTMELEADLGIDSIKRVEILSALKEKAPTLPDLDAMQASQLRTLGAICDALGPTSAPSAAPASAAPAPAATPPAAAAPTANGSADVSGIFLDVVADKTGYPKDALELTMELEADLGIDSIKRVEILSALKEKAPGLPDLDAMQASQLRTLGAICDALGAGGGPGGNGSGVAAEAAAPGAPSSSELPSATSVIWEETPPGKGWRPPLPEGRVVAVRSPRDSLTAAIVRELGALGIAAEPLDPGPLNGHTDHYGALVVTTGLEAPGSTAEALRELKRCFFDVQHMALALQRSAAAGGALLMGVQVTAGPDEDAGTQRRRAALGGLAGLVRTAGQEWPEVPTRVVDVDARDVDEAALAALVAREVGAGLDEETVRYRRGQRLARTIVETPVLDGAPLQRPVTVATGGARGVTAACLKTWAAEARPRLAILGRTDIYSPEPEAAAAATSEGDLVKALFAEARDQGEKATPAEVKKRARAILSSREARANLAAMEEAGAEVLYLPTDVSDVEALQGALEQVRTTFGPIEALVHGAGVLADKRIEDKTEDQLDLVLGTKAAGLLTLLDLLDEDPLRAICTFSSVAGSYGNAGQSDYAMANQVLDTVAERLAEARPGLRVRSLAWGPWEGGMVTPELKAHFEKRGVPLIPLEGGARLFAAEMSDVAAPPLRLVGASLASGEAPRPVRLRLAGERLALVDDHRVEGAPVVPAAFVADLLLEAGRRRRGRRPAGLADLKVLKGLRLDELPEHLDVEVELLADGGDLTALLRVAGDPTPRYAATLLDDGLDLAGPVPALADGEVDERPLYPERLFHGPRFHLIAELTAVTPGGLDARVKDLEAAGWPEGPWQLDAAAADAALQALLVFADEAAGGAFLPTAVGRLVGGVAGAGPLRLRLRGEAVGPDHVRADVWLLDDEDRCVLALLGAEAHRVPAAAARPGARAP